MEIKKVLYIFAVVMKKRNGLVGLKLFFGPHFLIIPYRMTIGK